VAEVVRPATGGIRRHVSDLLDHLDRRQFLPLLFAPDAFVPDRPLPDLSRYAIEIGASTRPLQDLKASGALAQLLRQKCNIVHAHGLRGAVVGGFAARRAHLPYLFTVHNELPRMNPVQAAVFRELARTAARVIAVSEAVATTLRQFDIPGNRIAVVPNGVDLSRFADPIDVDRVRKELGCAPTERIVLGVGRLAPEKGFDVLIEAFSALTAPLSDVRLILVGDGPDAAALRAQAEQNAARIDFLGHRTDIVSLLAVADLVVVPSRQEGQGIVPLEAMAAGRAVVASRVGGLIESIVDDETGMLIPPDNAPALCGTMETLLNDPARRAAMGATGRRRVEREYSLQTQIQKIEAIYRDVYRRTA
jgi:glycosyltransferase involved in cell wall biosynthesis